VPKHRCACGAKYRFPDAAIGKRGKCQRCGAVFTLAADDEGEGPIALADDTGLLAEVSAAAARSPKMKTGGGGHPGDQEHPVAHAVHGREETQPLVDVSKPSRGYGSSILWTFLFPSKPANLVTFGIVWVVLVLLSFGAVPCFLIGMLMGAWYASFRFGVIDAAASGEPEIPEISYSGDIMEELALPALKWFGSWIFVLSPALIYVVWMSTNDPSRSVIDGLMVIMAGVPGLLGGGVDDPILVALVAAALLVWPMVILCIALGGFGSIFRVDLLAATMVRSFPGYLVTTLIVAGATIAKVLLYDAMAAQLAPGTTLRLSTLLGSLAIVHILSIGVNLYCDIVMLRAIGLYYHHFKHRFAWEWE